MYMLTHAARKIICFPNILYIVFLVSNTIFTRFMWGLIPFIFVRTVF